MKWAAEEGRLGEKYKSVEKAEKDAWKKNERKLTPTGLDDGRLAVAEEDGNDKDCQGHAQHGNGDGNESVGRVPLHVAKVEVKTADLVGKGPTPLTAVQTLRLIEDVLVGPTRRADPAAFIACLRYLALPNVARTRAEGLGDAHELAEGVWKVVVGGAEGGTAHNFGVLQ